MLLLLESNGMFIRTYGVGSPKQDLDSRVGRRVIGEGKIRRAAKQAYCACAINTCGVQCDACTTS